MAESVQGEGTSDTLKGTVVRVRRGVAVYNANPFVLDMETKTRRVMNKTGDMMMVSRGTGEIKAESAGFWESHEVDGTQFIKLFVSGVKALKDLSQAGTKVFEVLYLRVQEQPNKDMINMGFFLLDQNITPMSERTYTRGLAELIEKQFIAATPMTSIYWLNPSFVWNGDRLAFVKEYRRRPSKAVPGQGLTPLFPPDDID